MLAQLETNPLGKHLDSSSLYILFYHRLKKQMPNDLDEAKEMALKLYNSVVEL